MLDLRRVLLISVAAGVLTKPLVAQRLSDAAGLRALSHIDHGAAVRVRVIAGPRLSGRYAGTLGDTMLLGASATATRLSTVALDSLWTRHRPIASTAIRGALLGGLLGAVMELARTVRGSCQGSNIFSRRWPYPNCRFSAGHIGRSAARGAAVTGAAGTALGVAFPVWRLRFP